MTNDSILVLPTKEIMQKKKFHLITQAQKKNGCYSEKELVYDEK